MRRRLRTSILVLLLVAAAVVAGCTPTGPGTTSAPGAPSTGPAPSAAGGYGY